MIQKNLYDSPIREVNRLYFDGKVIMRQVFNESNTQDQETYFVEFIDGSVTTVHYHETEQTLIPVSGNGIIGEFNLKSSTRLIDLCWEDFSIKPLKVGEIVMVHPHVLHFHGAIPGQNFSHISIRKMFNQSIEGNHLISRRSQTIWALEIIQELLDTKESSIVLDQLNKISNKVNENILAWISEV